MKDMKPKASITEVKTAKKSLKRNLFLRKFTKGKNKMDKMNPKIIGIKISCSR